MISNVIMHRPVSKTYVIKHSIKEQGTRPSNFDPSIISNLVNEDFLVSPTFDKTLHFTNKKLKIVSLPKGPMGSKLQQLLPQEYLPHAPLNISPANDIIMSHSQISYFSSKDNS